MYQSCINFERTEEERNNQMLSWQRNDKAFFASGACHILAFTMKELHPKRDLKIIYIKPKNIDTGHHVYVVEGEWAFDFNGWTKEDELLRVTMEAYTTKNPGWDYERVIVTDDLDTYCKQNKHRPPAYFAHLPWERTYKYIEQFSAKPPKN